MNAMGIILDGRVPSGAPSTAESVGLYTARCCAPPKCFGAYPQNGYPDDMPTAPMVPSAQISWAVISPAKRVP
jgi:hypothetical protein